MLEKPEERVRLLKAGLTGKEIEGLYVTLNGLEILRFSSPYEKTDDNTSVIKKVVKYHHDPLNLDVIPIL